ncbi:MAG: RHS repeat-associated core domain-containing protein, partial [Lachnospiraceae bacterium]|nr:RHS repeat-associated core domain-containing protein [Lachnospiraceae bacterium]
LGRVTKEWQDYHWISGKYDEPGNRIQVRSSFGADIITKRNALGQATHMAAYLGKEKPWAARMEYNALGQETRRLCSGGISSSFEYDIVGRPVLHEVSVCREDFGKMHSYLGHTAGYSEKLRRNRYEWDINYQLKKITNELTNGNAVFSYDEFSNLVCARESGFDTIFRMTDNVGNIYETQDNSDRIYGEGSRLEQSGINLKEKMNSFQGGYGRLVTKVSKFFYDEEGNLAKKIEPDGGTWIYNYFGNGMLKRVIKPDRSGVRFKYDPLGRRIEKTVSRAGSEEVPEIEEAGKSVEESVWEKVGGVKVRKRNIETKKSYMITGKNESVYAEEGINSKQIQKVIRFMWDGNTLLHEWEEDSTADRLKPKSKIDYKADFVAKIEKEEEERRREEAERGQRTPDSLVTWIFQDDFVPRGKITKDGVYSIVSDYLGTPVVAYEGDGNKVWERELDIYGRVKTGRKDVYGRTEKEIGEKGFIPFRFQGQYEDKETGLYYNRFRYYSPEDGCYTQQDPIGLAGGNPTVYGYVFNTLCEIDPLGLANLFQAGTYGGLNGGVHVGDGLQAHELIRHKYLVKQGLTTKNVRLAGNPSVALDCAHHTKVNGAHWYEAKIREEIYGLKSNEFHPVFKRELDITQGGLRKAGYPASQARKLRKEAEKFYKNQQQKKAKKVYCK